MQKVSLLKRNLLAAPFEKAFTEQEQYEDAEKPNPTSELMAVHYREEEAIYVQSSADRVTVLFSTKFKDETDKIFGKVFLQASGGKSDAFRDFADRLLVFSGICRCQTSTHILCTASTVHYS